MDPYRTPPPGYHPPPAPSPGVPAYGGAHPGPFQDLYRGMVARGMREDMALLTLARKFAALTLRLWKSGEHYDPKRLTNQQR